MNGSLLIESTAGIESTANTRSVKSTTTSTMKSGVQPAIFFRVWWRSFFRDILLLQGILFYKGERKYYCPVSDHPLPPPKNILNPVNTNIPPNIYTIHSNFWNKATPTTIKVPRKIKAPEYPEQYTMLVLLRHIEVIKNHNEHEQIIDTQRPFYYITGQKFKSFLRTKPVVNQPIKRQSQRRPEGHPGNRLFKWNRLFLFVHEAEIKRQHRQNKGIKADPEGWIFHCAKVGKNERFYSLIPGSNKFRIRFPPPPLRHFLLAKSSARKAFDETNSPVKMLSDVIYNSPVITPLSSTGVKSLPPFQHYSLRHLQGKRNFGYGAIPSPSNTTNTGKPNRWGKENFLSSSKFLFSLL